MPKDLSGESLQKAEVKSHNEDNSDDDGYDDDDNADNGYDDDDNGNNVNDRLRSCWRQQTGPRLITGMNLGGDLMTAQSDYFDYLNIYDLMTSLTSGMIVKYQC